MALHRQPKKEPPAILIAAVALVSTLALVVALGVFVIDPLLPKSKQAQPPVNPPFVAEKPTDLEQETISAQPSPSPSIRPTPTTPSRPPAVTNNAQPPVINAQQPVPVPVPLQPRNLGPAQPFPLPQVPTAPQGVPVLPVTPPTVTLPQLPPVITDPVKTATRPLAPITDPVKGVAQDVTKNAPALKPITDPVTGLLP